MVQTLECQECGTLLRSSPRVEAGKKVKCLSCKAIFLVGVHPRFLTGQEVLLKPDLFAQDDEGSGGGDWGGSGKEEESEEDDEEEEVDEDGKKKKKKKKPKGFVASLVGGVMSYVIGAVVLLLLCCCAVPIVLLFGKDTSYIGTWEKLAKDDKGEEYLEHKLVIASGNTGNYTDKNDKVAAFKWSVPDEKEKKNITLDMVNSNDTFWNNLKSKTEFTWATTGTGNGSTLTLTPVGGGDAITFTREFVEPNKSAPPPRKKRR